MTGAQHSRIDPNWMTPGAGQPVDYVSMIRTALGGVIDLDPFSSQIANQSMGARRIYNEAADGFSCPWFSSSLVINPPGGQVKRAWRKLCTEVIDEGRTAKAIWVGFSVEQLCILASEVYHPLEFSCVILRKRISFVREDGTTGSPSHGNYLVGMNVTHDVFTTVFSPHGKIIKGALAK